MIDGKVVNVLQKSELNSKAQKEKTTETAALSSVKDVLLECLHQWDSCCSSFTKDDVKINSRVQRGLQEYSCPIFYSHKLQHLYWKESQLLQILQSSLTSLQHEGITSVTIDNHFINYHTNTPVSPKTSKSTSIPIPSTSTSLIVVLIAVPTSAPT